MRSHLNKPKAWILRPGDRNYPAKLLTPSGAEPAVLAGMGNPTLLGLSLTAVFCSVRCPGSAILAGMDLARAWRNEGRAIIGGFHSPVEQEVLSTLLKGRNPIIVVPARSLEKMRIPESWQSAIRADRLMVVSPFTSLHRKTADLADRRNQFVAMRAHEVTIIHAAPGRKTHMFAQQLLAGGQAAKILS